MGVYLNPGNQGFRESIRSKIYVDKTELIACTKGLKDFERRLLFSCALSIIIITDIRVLTQIFNVEIPACPNEEDTH